MGNTQTERGKWVKFPICARTDFGNFQDVGASEIALVFAKTPEYRWNKDGYRCCYLDGYWYVPSGGGQPVSSVSDEFCWPAPLADSTASTSRSQIKKGAHAQPVPDPQAFKADAGKPNWFLLMSGQGCAHALAAVVRVLSFAVRSKEQGGKGYAEHSWRTVPNAKERYEAALYRHLSELSCGRTHDEESGESHWAHVATNALFLAELHRKE